jgi:hypothetical protein
LPITHTSFLPLPQTALWKPPGAATACQAPPFQRSAQVMSDAGWALFDAAITWATRDAGMLR